MNRDSSRGYADFGPQCLGIAVFRRGSDLAGLDLGLLTEEAVTPGCATVSDPSLECLSNEFDVSGVDGALCFCHERFVITP